MKGTPAGNANPIRRYRTLWISDVHLGYAGCRADDLLAFLQQVEVETLYLVGDILDLWALQRSAFWSADHTRVITALLDRLHAGTRLVYVVGNHDAPLRREAEGLSGLGLVSEAEHVTADGRRLWIVHGDRYDALMACGRLQHVVGNLLYDLLMFLNRHVHRWRRRFGFGHWSLAAFIKRKVPNARQHIEKYETLVAHDAGMRGYDGVICGHIHHPGLREIAGVVYANTGDWVENCTALVEHDDGRLELVSWPEQQAQTAGLSAMPSGSPRRAA